MSGRKPGPGSSEDMAAVDLAMTPHESAMVFAPSDQKSSQDGQLGVSMRHMSTRNYSANAMFLSHFEERPFPVCACVCTKSVGIPCPGGCGSWGGGWIDSLPSPCFECAISKFVARAVLVACSG